MKKVNVSGIGIINRMGTTVDEVWQNLTLGGAEESMKRKGKVDYKSVLSSREQRRMNRYSDMSVNAVSRALEDGGIDVGKDVDPYRIGTIFSTGYGAMDSNLRFSDSVLDGDPDLCSPTIFANTVSNACIGHICIKYGCKGVSTVVMGSNSIGYSQMLLSKGDADYILTGAVEEYNEELFHCLEETPYAKGADLAEATVAILLSGSDEDAYCRLVDFMEVDISAYPLINPVGEENLEIMKNAMETFLKRQGRKIDAVITGSNGTYFDAMEQKVLTEILGEDVIYVHKQKKYFGETLGASVSLSVALGAMCLKNNRIPKCLGEKEVKEEDIHTVLIAGFDVTGNYIAYLMTSLQE